MITDSRLAATFDSIADRFDRLNSAIDRYIGDVIRDAFRSRSDEVEHVVLFTGGYDDVPFVQSWTGGPVEQTDVSSRILAHAMEVPL